MPVNLRKEFNTAFAAPDIYRRLVENLHAGIYVADAPGNLVYVNQSFVNILGYQSKDEVIGLNLAQQLFVHPEDCRTFLQKMEKTGFVRDYEIENRRKDGSIVVLSVTSDVIYGERNEVVGVEGVIRDISEHKKLQKDSVVFRNAVEQTADHVMITDKKGLIQYVNPAFEKTTGYARGEVLGKTPKILQSGKQGREYYQKLWDTILSGRIFHAETINKAKNGKFYVADQTISPITNEYGEITHFVSIWQDITERARLEERLRTEKQKLEQIIGFDEKITLIRKSDKLMDFVVSMTLKILEAGRCSIMLIDKENEELCVKGSEGFADDSGPIRVKINESICAKVIHDGQPLLVTDIDSDPRFLPSKKARYAGRSFMIIPIKRDGDTVGVINVTNKIAPPEQDGVFNDVDVRVLCAIAKEVAVAIENVRFYKELQYLTITDPLTDIHNFRHFSQHLEDEIKRLKRFPEDLGLIMMDIDNFKSYNDQLGHLAGDRLLKAVGKIIQENLREVDVLCRYAGDEFVIILPETGKTGSSVLAERIRNSIERAKLDKPVTVSIGVAQYKDGMTKHELISKADRALYQAKKEGKDRVCIFG